MMWIKEKKLGIFPGIQNVTKKQKINLTAADVLKFFKCLVRTLTSKATQQKTPYFFFTFRPVGMNEMGDEDESRKII